MSSYNNFKSTTIRGAFNNLNYPDNNIQAVAYFQNNVSISGGLYTDNVNIIYLNGCSVSNIIYNNYTISSYIISNNLYNLTLSNSINNLGYSLYNNFIYQDLINTSISSTVFNNFINQNLINNTISNSIYNINTNNSLSGFIYNQNLINLTLSSSIYNNFSNQNLINLTLSSSIYNNFNNQNLINDSLSGSIYNNLNNQSLINTTINNDIYNIKTITNNFTWEPIYSYLNLNNANLGLYKDLYLSPTSNFLLGNQTVGFSTTPITNLKNLPYLDVTSSIKTDIDNIKTVTNNLIFEPLSNYININNCNLGIYKTLYLSPASYFMLGNSSTGYSSISVNFLKYLDVTSSLNTTINNINSSINNLNSKLTKITYDSTYYYTNIQDSVHIYGNLNLGGNLTVQTNQIYFDISPTTLSYIDQTSSIQGQFNNITSNYATTTALNTAITNINIGNYLLSSDAASTYALKNYLPTTSNVSANATTGTFYLVLTNNNAGGSSNLSIGIPSYDATNKILKVNSIDAGAATNSLIYNSLTTGTITIGGALTTGNVKIGINTQTGINQINGPTTFTGNVIFNNTISGNITGSSSSCTGNALTSSSCTGNALTSSSCTGNALTSSSCTGNALTSSSCTGNALTSSSCTGNSATSTTASNIAITTDNTTTSLYIPMTTASTTNSSVSLKIDNGLVYNAVTNALTSTTFIGALTGNCSGSSSSCTGNAATSTTTVSVGLTADNTSTSLYIPMTSATTTTTATSLKIDTGLSYNASTNTLTTTTFNGTITGSLDGVAGSTYSIYNTLTTGSVNFLANVTTGILNIGKSGATGAINLLNNVINIGTSTSTLTLNGLIKTNNGNYYTNGTQILSSTTTLTYPLYEYYAIETLTGITITLPALSASTLGLKITLYRSYLPTSTTASDNNILCNANDKIYISYNSNNVTSTGWSYSTIHRVFISGNNKSGTGYAWYDIK